MNEWASKPVLHSIPAAPDPVQAFSPKLETTSSWVLASQKKEGSWQKTNVFGKQR